MLSADRKSLLFLYQGHRVRLTMNSGKIYEGRLEAVEENSIRLTDRSVSLEELEDIQYTGFLTGYHSSVNAGEIDRVYRFELSDCIGSNPAALTKYCEFVYRAACHLVVQENAIRATDVLLLDCVHVLNGEILSQGCFLYTFADGSCRAGALVMEGENCFLRYKERELWPFEQKDVTDITRFPEVNDCVTAVTRDGHTYKGIVSAVQETVFNLFSEIQPVTVSFAELSQLRFHGRITEDKGMIDGRYQCRYPQYLHEGKADPRFFAGVSVSYVAGVNGRGLIAKDVIIEEEAEGKAAEEHLGVILVLDMSKPDGVGYIGRQYTAKSCGVGIKGDVRFNREQISFPFDYNKIYVVKYTLIGNQEGSRIKNLARMELVEAYDYAKYGIVRINENNEVEAVPLFRAGIRFYEMRDVDVICRDGSVHSGILVSHDEAGIQLRKGENISAGMETVPFAGIENVRIFGTVSQYYSNGTGYIDNSFFFHINEMKHAFSAQSVHRGVLLSFVLRNSRKGNGVDCMELEVLREENEEVYVTGCRNNVYRVLDAAGYGKEASAAERQIVSAVAYNPFRDLESNDYHAVLTIQRKNGQRECVSVRILNTLPKLLEAYITEVDGELVKVVSRESYEKKPEGRSCVLAHRMQLHMLKNAEQMDYLVRYRIREQQGQQGEIEILEVVSECPKRYFGYLDNYYPAKEFGFITPEEFYGKISMEERKKQEIDIYSHLSVYKDKPAPIDTNQYCYYVSYTLNTNVQGRKAPALSMWFLEARKKGKKAAGEGKNLSGEVKAASPESTEAERAGNTAGHAEKTEAPSGTENADSVAAVKNMVPSVNEGAAGVRSLPARVERISLSERFGDSGLKEGIRRVYGIVSVYSHRFSVLKVHDFFQNKTLCGPEELRDGRLLVCGETGKTAFQSEDGNKMNTSRYVYVVRFVPGEERAEDAGEALYGMNYEYPVEILAYYGRKQIKSLLVEGDILTVESTERMGSAPAQVPVSITPAIPEVVTETAPEMMYGESILYRNESGAFEASEYEGREKDGILLRNGAVLNPDKDKIYRFGLLTGFDASFQRGYLNGKLQFRFSDMETRAFNIIKAGRKKILLVYSCENGRVTRLERLSQEALNALAWTSGIVTDFVVAETEKLAIINETIYHYLSVLSDGWVSRMAADKNLIHQNVYIKEIYCPDWGREEEQALIGIAADIHCEQETATIRYDAVQDKYMAYRNSTHFLPVEGKGLSSLVDAETTVSFVIGENPSILTACIRGEEKMADTVDGSGMEEDDSGLDNSTTVMSSSLGRFCMERIDLRKMMLPRSISLDETGWPVTEEQLSQLFVYLCSMQGSSSLELIAAAGVGARMSGDALNAALQKVPFRGVKSRSVEGLLRVAFRYRSQEIAWDSDGILGEYTYYVATLLRGSRNAASLRENIYRLFLQDFYGRVGLSEEVRRLYMGERHYRKSGHGLRETDLSALFGRSCSPDDVRQLAAHILMLDERSLEYLFESGALQKNQAVTEAIMEFGREIDNTQSFESVTDLLYHLRNIYQQDKRRFTNLFQGIKNSFCKSAEDILKVISQRFLKLLCRDDAERFQTLEACCSRVEANRYSGFYQYEKALKEAYRQVYELEMAAREHPTPETTEMLLQTGILHHVSSEIMQELDGLYRDEKCRPMIRCVPNEYEVAAGQTSLILLLENGENNATNLQTAYNLTVRLEPVTEGVSVQTEVRVPQKELQPGVDHRITLSVPIELSGLEEDSFILDYSVEYTCTEGFNGVPVSRRILKECEEPLYLQIRHRDMITKNENAVNPYEIPASGEPLLTGEMFFGRKQEFREIWNYIVTPEEELVPGRVVIVYGQKKCGKTSLINQIKNEIAANERIYDQAIVLDIDNTLMRNGGPDNLPYFTLNLYSNILRLFRNAVHSHHADVEEQMRQCDLKIPRLTRDKEFAAALFQEFFDSFNAMDQGHHKVVLIMDEFTLLCTSIIQNLPSHPDYKYIPNFIKMLSGMGFIQIIVGHAAMMRAFSQLGSINHTAEFAKRVEISALKKDDAGELICSPMRDAFGYDPYQTPLGKRAVDNLLELSGCSPSVLMRLCDQMFRYYVKKSDGSQILDADVTEMIRQYIDTLDMSAFDMLLTEDGDEEGFFDERPSYLYLRHVARESFRSNNHDCDINVVCPELGEQASNEMRETLLDRKVLSAGNGRIRINVGLFAEFIRRRYGAA